MGDVKTHADLQGITETLLWPLYCRAEEARRPDALIDDHNAIELRDRIDYPFADNFGSPRMSLVLRALSFDLEIKRFIQDHPTGTVVALGEGLETQFWRVDNGHVQWLSVDLPETQQLRRRLIPETPRIRVISESALDHRWMDEVGAGPVFITAQGLFMYLEEAEVMRLISACAERFPGGTLMFDAMPRWLMTRTSRGSLFSSLFIRGGKKGSQSYRLPPLRWAASAGQLQQLRDLHPGIAEVRDVPFPPGRGFVFGFLYPRIWHSRFVRNKRPSNALVRFRT